MSFVVELAVKFKKDVMDITEALKSLALDSWYKLLVWIGGLVTLGAIFIDVQVLTNREILPFSIGVFLIGLGEWASRREEPFERETAHGSTFRGREMTRFHSFPGNMMTIFGLLSIIVGLYQVFAS